MAKKKEGDEAPKEPKEKLSQFDITGIYPAVTTRGQIFELFETIDNESIEKDTPKGVLSKRKKLYPSMSLLLVRATKKTRKQRKDIWGHIYRRVERSIVFTHTDILDLDKMKAHKSSD